MIGTQPLPQWICAWAVLSRHAWRQRTAAWGFDFVGTYTNVVEHKLIEYSFGDRAAQVEFADTPKGVRVRVTFDSEPTHSIEQQRDGWQAILNNFTRHVEASR